MSELWTRSRWLVAAAAIAALSAWGLSLTGTPSMPREALAAAPAGSSIVARIDVAAVTSSHLWDVLLEEDEDEHGVRRIERVCGYDPLDEVEEAVVFVSGTDERPFAHVGFLARGEMARGSENRTRLVECVGAVVGDQGGAVRRVEVEGEPAIASASGGSHAMFIGGDAVVGGDRATVGRAVRVARGDEASAATDATLSRLWARISPDRDIVAVAHLPGRWIPALRRMARDLEGDLVALASIRALGVGVRVRNGLAIGIAAETARASHASRLEAAVRERIDAALEDSLTRLSAVGRGLRRARVEAQGTEVVLTLNLTNAQLDDLLELWRQLRRARARGDAEPAPPAADGADDEAAEPEGDAPAAADAGRPRE